jgi:hypothetical protein
MPVQFSCNACKKKFKAADKFAGKTIPCPNCKVPLIVPALPAGSIKPETPPPIASVKTKSQAEQDIEAMAALALEETKQEEEVAPQFIQFECTFCDEKVSFPIDLGGKQAPCPGCRRILKVPMPVVVKKTGPDWKKQPDKRPSGALRKEEPELEGTWNSTMDTVSRDALLEAGAIVEEYEPLTRAEKIKRTVMVLVVLVSGLLGYYYYSSYQGKVNGDAQIAKIELSIKSGDLANFAGEIKAVLLAGIASYRLTENPDIPASKIKKTLQSALASLDKASSLFEKDFALLELSRSIVELGGGKDDVRDNKKLKWDEVQKFLKQPFESFTIPEIKLLALKEATSSFIASGETDRALAFASQVLSGSAVSKDKKIDDHSDFLAVVGMELFKAQKIDASKQILESIRTRYTSAPTTPVSPFAAAFFTVAEKDKPLPFVFPKDSNNEADIFCLLCVDLINDKLETFIGSSNFKNYDAVLRLNCLTKVSFLASVLGKDVSILKDELNRVVSEGVMPNVDCVQSYLVLAAISQSLKISSESWFKAADKVPQAMKDYKLIKSKFLLASFLVKDDFTSATLEDANKMENASLSKAMAYQHIGINSKKSPWFKEALLKTSEPEKSFGYLGIALSADNNLKKK